MNTSSRFAVAIHILIYLSMRRRMDGQPTKSDQLAQSADTNPVVIRRLMGQLREAGLVVSKSGPNGGFLLEANPEMITLADIHDAVEEKGTLFHLHYGCPMEACPVGGNVQDVLNEVFDEAKAALRKVLAQKTLAEVAHEVAERSGLTEMLEAGMTQEEILAQYEFVDGVATLKSLVA